MDRDDRWDGYILDYSKGGGQETASCRSSTGLLQSPHFICSYVQTKDHIQYMILVYDPWFRHTHTHTHTYSEGCWSVPQISNILFLYVICYNPLLFSSVRVFSILCVCVCVLSKSLFVSAVAAVLARYLMPFTASIFS